MKKVLTILFCILVLTGCERKLENRNIKKPKKIDEENVVKTEIMTNFDELLNNKENKGFVLSTYTSYDKIDFKELLTEFPEKYRVLLDNTSYEYKTLITKYSDFDGKTIYKLTKSNLKKYIKEKTKYALDDFEKINLEELAYLETYDSYYTIGEFSSELIDTYNVVIDENIYSVYYKYNGNKYKLVLKKIDNDYLFTSNIINN